jgi:hypothetical protein
MFFFGMIFQSSSQLPAGSIAPDFTVTDINGNSHHLYEYLAQGYTVVVQFDAAWNGPGWNYANTGALANLYYDHGVDFGGNVIVLFLEADGTTSLADIQGNGQISQGDWTMVIPFPIVNLPTLNGYNTQVGNDYNIAYYPTIYTICPNGVVTETGQISALEHWDFIQNAECQSVYNVDAYIHDYTGQIATCSEVEIEFSLTNLGFAPLTSGQFTVTGVSPAITTTWNGYLNQLESTTINLGTSNVVGPVQIVFNNFGEENSSNNTLVPNILNSQFTISNVLQVDLMTDCWPEETTWNITDALGNVVYSSMAYGDGGVDNQQNPIFDNVNIVLPEIGCYFFNIYDAYGDGMYGTVYGCSVDGVVSLYEVDANFNVISNLYSIGGNQQFSVFSVPFYVDQMVDAFNNVTLNVDMNDQIVSPNGVHLAGSFQNWNPTDPNFEMFDLDGDGIYSISFYLQAGQYEYKFVNGNEWSGANNDNETIPTECSSNGNRSLIVQNNIVEETYCYNSCFADCNNGTGGVLTGNCLDIFISEYVEGTGNNKAIELYNPTSNEIDLQVGNYSMGRELNGSGIPMLLPLTGVIPPHGTRVFVLDKRDPNGTGNEVPVWEDLQMVADTFVNPVYVQSNSPFYFNGDDSFVLVKNGNILLDVIGKIGEDPGTGWFDPNDPTMTPLTMDRTLVRKSNIGQGVGVNPSVFNPVIEWDVYPANDFSHLGWHESWCQNNLVGCLDQTACNYNSTATIDDGSCFYVGTPCDDGFASTIADQYNVNCECQGFFSEASGCDPASIDWDSQTSLFLPDTVAGDNLISGFINEYYSDHIYINTPLTLDSWVGVSSIPLESAILTDVQIFNNGEWFSLMSIGLFSQCNNGQAIGDCTFLPGIPGCIEIFGEPITTGIFPVRLTFTVTGAIFGFPITEIVSFDGYEIVITENPYGCTDAAACNFTLNASLDDGSCLYEGNPCDDGDPNTFGDLVGANCDCSGSEFDYGAIYDYYFFFCGDNTQGIDLSFSQLPSGISEYALQWYSREGIQSAPTGSSTSGWTIIPGANSAVYTTDYFSSNRTVACLVMPYANTGIPYHWANGSVQFEVSDFSAQSIIGNPNITPFTNYVYVVNPIAGNTYEWTTVNGGIISGQGTNTVTVMWGQNGPYQISLNESNGLCSDQSTLFVVNNSCAISVTAVSENGNFLCPGSSASLQAVTSAAGVSFQWYLNGVLLSGETSSTLEISAGGNYQVMITQANCTAISQMLVISELSPIVIPELTLSQDNPGCSGGSAVISATGGSFSAYLWSNGAVTSTIEVTSSGDYTVEVTDNNGCMATAGPVNVNFALQEAVPICLVTVDPATGSNVIVWEPVASEVTSSYVVYKESNIANVYQAIGTVPYGNDGLFEDVNSNSAVQASRYKLALVDTCDVESSMSDFHKTIHLTSNLGLGNTINLIWSHYEGFTFGSYTIYRGTSADNMTVLATIASNLNSYTDLTPLPTGYYMIEVEGVSCDPSRSAQTSRSNIINFDLVGLNEKEESRIQLYPNPAIDLITLQVSASQLGKEYVVYDVSGRQLFFGQLKSTSTKIDISSLSVGSYLVKAGNEFLRFTK